MAINDPLCTVQRMFAAFRAGDLDRILETVHSDSHWTYVGANPKPTKAELVGHASVRPSSWADQRRSSAVAVRVSRSTISA
jgi:ketosteroid isomerase-like protein